MHVKQAIAALAVWCLPAMAPAEIDATVRYLQQEIALPSTLSNLDPRPDDLGIQGAQLGATDTATTSRFLRHSYDLDVVRVPVDGDFDAAPRAALDHAELIIVDAPAQQVLALADMATGQNALIVTAAAQDTDLRAPSSRANLSHTHPSLAMQRDVLMPLSLLKRRTKLAMVAGTHPEDLAFAAAQHRSAHKFGLKIGAEKTWAIDTDRRRNPSAEVPQFTQDLGKHDVLQVADEPDDFGRYVMCNTWLPRPLAGSESGVPTAWSPSGKIAITTSETTDMAHWIDTEQRKIFANTWVDSRPCDAEFTQDGTELWVSSEIGGTVTIFDVVTQTEKEKLAFELPNSHADRIQPVEFGFGAIDELALIGLGPANHITVVNAKTLEVEDYIPVGCRDWHMTFNEGKSLLFTTNSISGDVTVVDLNKREAIKSIKVGRFRWGAAFREPDQPALGKRCALAESKDAGGGHSDLSIFAKKKQQVGAGMTRPLIIGSQCA